MTNNFLIDYLVEQENAFFSNYNAAIKTLDVDAVHDMRVAVKRISTIVRMLNFNEKANFRLKKRFKPIRFVYKNFGKIRDLQVLQSLIVGLQNKTDTNLNQLIIDCENHTKNEVKILHEVKSSFKNLAIKRNFKLIERYIKKKGDKDLGKKILLYKKERANQLSDYSNKLNKEHNLHNARKMIKDIGYLMEMSTEVLPDFAADLKTYKELGRLLGTWHDRKVLLSYLKRKKTNHQLNNTAFNQLLEEIIKEVNELENKYYSLISF
jgi:CHAD domain-containing protein